MNNDEWRADKSKRVVIADLRDTPDPRRAAQAPVKEEEPKQEEPATIDAILNRAKATLKIANRRRRRGWQ